ncbi:hypothetical protein Dimus_018915 [Dionaea muscipula]
MAIFLRTKMHKDSLFDGEIFMSALYYSVSRIMFNESTDVGLTFLKLSAFYKQRDFLFFPTWAFALSQWIMKFPINFLAIVIWVFATYYVIGYDPDVGRHYFKDTSVHSSFNILPNSTEPLGVVVLKYQGLFPNAYWYWLRVGMLIGFTILLNILYTLALTFLNPIRKAQAVIAEDIQTKEQNESAGAVEAKRVKESRMVLPFEKHFITFSDIRYSIDMPKEMRKQAAEDRLELLKGVS